MPTTRVTRRTSQVPFADKLVLNQWLLSLFNVRSFGDLAKHLRDEEMEGLDKNNIHRFHHALSAHFFNLRQLPKELLLKYDQNIVRHTERLNRHREEPIRWKYFQYLTLLFSEIYLDSYFRDPELLLENLNAQISAYNADCPESERIAEFDETKKAWPQLNKLAFWMATGSGKTLLMHVNILQYQDTIARYDKKHELNRILLLTPNEGLSQQHLREFEAAGINAERFNKDGRSLLSGQVVEVLEITRLGDKMGDKTIAVEAFEENNLVLVDEGHRGTSSGNEGAWMGYRNALCDKGFSFEYSATFGQAIKGSPKLTQLYAKNTLCDYSYRYFYEDGFGKDYQILNLDEDMQQSHLDLYLVASLLSFFQQQLIYRRLGKTFRPFNVESPLWIFVGGRVTKRLSSRDASDIVSILQFLNRFVANRAESIRCIKQIMDRGLETSTGKNLLAGHFDYLNSTGFSPTQIFKETLATVFNAHGGGQLYIENLKGVTGEIALRLGADNEAFGVINVGDDSGLMKRCNEHSLKTSEREFAGSLFHEINQPHSAVNLLIGSKKFTEGWSSWRVSTMGLMNVGRGEGAQIIQLFGRGVRLKGYNNSLKRSSRAQLPDSIIPPKHISLLETLGVFGVRADYMAQFRDFLAEEGLAYKDGCIEEILLPVTKNLETQWKLKTIRLKRPISDENTELSVGEMFRKLAPVPIVRPPDPQGYPSTKHLQKNPLILNWYPKIQSMKSGGVTGDDVDVVPNEDGLAPHHIAFLDLDRLYFELERFKADRGWYNLNISRDVIEALLDDKTWYRLQIPTEKLVEDSYEKVSLWQEIALALLKKYIERYYFSQKRAWELPRLELRTLKHDDSNFLDVKGSPNGKGRYRVLIDSSQENIVTELKKLKTAIKNGTLSSWDSQGIKAIHFENHLYQPLLSLDTNDVKIVPAPLNKDEYRFVEDLKRFHDGHTDFFKTRGLDLYLLRNRSRGRGVGFFEADNYYPDFIMWLLTDNLQHIVFVDPKGIFYLESTNPKVKFSQTIKKIEHQMDDSSVRLDAFIISNTPFTTMQTRWDMGKAEMQKLNILFQEDDGYIELMLKSVLNL